MGRTTRPVAEASPPGEFLREESEARGRTRRDLAEIPGRPAQVVSAIVTGKKEITPRTALELAAAFGTSADYRLGPEARYRPWRAGEPDPAIAERARRRSSAAAG